MSISYLKLHNLFQYLVSLKIYKRNTRIDRLRLRAMTMGCWHRCQLVHLYSHLPDADVFFSLLLQVYVYLCVFISKQTVLKRIFRYFFFLLIFFYRDFWIDLQIYSFIDQYSFLLPLSVLCTESHANLSISYGTGKIESNDRNIYYRVYERAKEKERKKWNEKTIIYTQS